MNVDAGTAGLLKALQTLDHTSRGHVLEHQPVNVVRDVLLLLLHKQDAASAPLHTPRAHATAAPHQVVPAHEQSVRVTKRIISAATPDPSKRARADLAPLDDGNGRTQIMMEIEREVIDLMSDTGEPEAEALNQPENKEVRQPRDLPMYLQVRTGLGHDTLTDIDDLPVKVQIELKGRFDRMWSFHTHKTNKYAALTFNAERHTEKDMCIRRLILSGSWDEGKMWSLGGEPREAADDRCIKARDPCAYFAKHNDQHVIIFVPLPQAHRYGRDWTDLGYWVLGA